MNRHDALNRFQFDDHLTLNENIYSITGVKPNAVINYRQRELSSYRHPEFFQFVREADLICAFQQSGPERCVYLDRTTNDTLCDLI